MSKADKHKQGEGMGIAKFGVFHIWMPLNRPAVSRRHPSLFGGGNAIIVLHLPL